ncbi:hypothetical protein GGR51DRAFT_556764 [Nemania sp. FL0031]|nr:hypothetical protein GGR51DRAFT_556764 [Nemania sp. FL0031]
MDDNESSPYWVYFATFGMVAIIIFNLLGWLPILQVRPLIIHPRRVFRHLHRARWGPAAIAELILAILEATDIMLKQVIPLLTAYEALEPIDLWNSRPYGILFSIDILLDTMKPSLESIIL